MRVFISWSGQRSQIIAEALRDWLVRVIQRLEPWVSTEDIRAGARWQIDVSGVLASTKVGILCLTPESLESRWLNFEAGALAKTIDNTSFVCPYLIGMEPGDVPLPLGQFQAKRADYEGTKSLIRTINSAMEEASLSEEQLSDAFEVYWPRLKKSLDDLPPPNERVVQRRGPQELLEEILSIVRGLARDQSAPREEEQSRLAAYAAALDGFRSWAINRDPPAKSWGGEYYVLRGKPSSRQDNKEGPAVEEVNKE